MKRWIISDTHFGHTNIIKYCNRPYKNVEEMDEDIIQKWNKFVQPDDIVYHLGDFSLSKKDSLSKLVSKLNGKIVLIRGNHDRENYKAYINAGFYAVYNLPVILDDFIILSHHPKFIEKNSPYINIYGHVHDSTSNETISETGACVCVERWNYEPIDLDILIQVICAKRGDI